MGQPRSPTSQPLPGTLVAGNSLSFIHLNMRPSWQLKNFPIIKVYNESNISIYPLYKREYSILAGKKP